MNNSFWGLVGIPLQIKTVYVDSLSKALEIVYKDNDYLFRNSRWFVDINNCFRIFNFNGTVYISKKTSVKCPFFGHTFHLPADRSTSEVNGI